MKALQAEMEMTKNSSKVNLVPTMQMRRKVNVMRTKLKPSQLMLPQQNLQTARGTKRKSSTEKAALQWKLTNKGTNLTQT